MKFDQHFMSNEKLIDKIVSYLEKPFGKELSCEETPERKRTSLKEKNETILEIGAGSGNLTKKLKGNIIAVEIDKELIKELEKIKNIKIINDNILNCIDKIKFDKIVGNIPYNISEPLLNKLIKLKFKFAVLTIPEKFIKKPLIKLVLNEFFDFEVLEKVSKKDFKPEPKVNSIVIKLIPKKYGLFGEIYLQQDKKLKNAIQEAYCRHYKISKKEALKKIPKFDFLNKKGFELNSEEWKKIAHL